MALQTYSLLIHSVGPLLCASIFKAGACGVHGSEGLLQTTYGCVVKGGAALDRADTP